MTLHTKNLLKDVRVETYEVKAGEYIQIIDTSGRQCSDFLAFDKAKLDKRIESIIDATATRTFMGACLSSAWFIFKIF